MEWHSRAQQEWTALRAGVFPSLRREGAKETDNVISFTDGRLMGLPIYKMGLMMRTCTISSQAFTRRTLVSRGGAGKVLAWGERPPPSSPGGDAPPSPVRKEPSDQTPSSGHRSGVRYNNAHFNTDLFALCSPLWLEMHFQAVIKYKLYTPVGHPRDLSAPACPLSEVITASLQLQGPHQNEHFKFRIPQ